MGQEQCGDWDRFLYNIKKISALLAIFFIFLVSLMLAGIGIYVGTELKFQGFWILLLVAGVLFLGGFVQIYHYKKLSERGCRPNEINDPGLHGFS